MATFLLMVQNTGNTEDSYSATIMGDQRAGHGHPGRPGRLADAVDRRPSFCPACRPGRSSSQADLSAVGQGTVTVEVQSLTNSAINASPAALVTAMPVLTKTKLTGLPNPSTFGATVTFTATVSPQFRHVNAAGTIAFTIDGVPQAPDRADGRQRTT